MRVCWCEEIIICISSWFAVEVLVGVVNRNQFQISEHSMERVQFTVCKIWVIWYLVQSWISISHSTNSNFLHNYLNNNLKYWNHMSNQIKYHKHVSNYMKYYKHMRNHMKYYDKHVLNMCDTKLPLLRSMNVLLINISLNYKPL